MEIGVRGDRFFTVCWTDLSEGAKNMKIFVSHVNIPPRVTPAEEGFSNKIDRIVCFLNVSESPSLATSVTG